MLLWENLLTSLNFSGTIADNLYVSTQKQRMKLSDFAKQQGMKYISVYKLWQQGAIEGIQIPSGTILVSGWKEPETEGGLRAIVYARVASPKQVKELNEQAKRLTEYAGSQDYSVVEVIEEIAPGFSGVREKFLEILARDDWDVLVVDNKEAAIKFGFEYLEASLAHSGRKIDYKTNLQSNGEQTLAKLLTIVSNLMRTQFGLSQKRTIVDLINRIDT